MSPTRQSTANVLEQFPDEWHVIVELVRESEDFRELSNHYVECITVLDRLRRAENPDEARVAEYVILTHELEFEMRNMIQIAGEGRS